MKTVLLTPGPTMTPDWIWEAMRANPLYHRTKTYSVLMEELRDSMRNLFGCPQGQVLFFSAAGTDMMERVCANYITDHNVLVLNTGFFGNRWKQIAMRYARSSIYEVNSQWGRTFPLTDLNRIFYFYGNRHRSIKLVLMQASDTSTGIRNNVQKVSATIRLHAPPQALLAIDAVLEAGVSPLKMDQQGIDILIGAGQKAFMLPPGLGFIILNPQAVDRLAEHKVTSYVHSLADELVFTKDLHTRYTAPVSHLVGLRAVLKHIDEIGEKNWYDAYGYWKHIIDARLSLLGFKRFTQGRASKALSIMRLPESKKFSQIADALEREGFIIASGIDIYAKNVIRIAHFQGIEPEDRMRFLQKMEEIL